MTEGFEDTKVFDPILQYWKPTTAGDILQGEYIKKYESTNQRGEKHDRYVLQDKDGNQWVLQDLMDIRNTFCREQFIIGVTVRIRLDSIRKMDNGNNQYKWTIGIVKV